MGCDEQRAIYPLQWKEANLRELVVAHLVQVRRRGDQCYPSHIHSLCPFNIMTTQAGGKKKKERKTLNTHFPVEEKFLETASQCNI